MRTRMYTIPLRNHRTPIRITVYADRGIGSCICPRDCYGACQPITGGIDRSGAASTLRMARILEYPIEKRWL